MKEEDLRKVFEKLIGIIGIQAKFKTREFSETNYENKRKSDSYLELNRSDEYIDKINDNFIINNIVSFIKTFYDKSPANFKTMEYKLICEAFNKKICNENIRNKIELIISTEMINPEDFLPEGDLYPLINFQIMLEDGTSKKICIKTDKYLVNSDDATSLTVFQPNANKARVYVNPSSQDFSNFIKYVSSKCIENEIMIDHKIRYIHTKADKIIYYVPIDHLGNFLNILNKYEYEHQDKVAEYNLPPTLLARNSHKWYGYGHMGTAEGHGYTLNDCMDLIINFAFLMLFVNNYERVGYRETEEFKQKMCATLRNASYVDIKKNKLNINYFNISKQVSQFYEQHRGVLNLSSISEEQVAFVHLKSCLTVQGGSILFDDVNIREKFNDYCKKHLDELTDELKKHIFYIQQQIPFLDNSNVYLSSNMAKIIENNANIIRNFITVMHPGMSYMTKEDSEREKSEFLNKVGGLDNVILALDYCKGIESLTPDELSKAEFYLDRLRKKRGLNIIKNKTPLHRLSRFEAEDASFDKIREIISQYDYGRRYGNNNDQKQYDIYKFFIDSYSYAFNEETVTELVSSINKNIQMNFYKRKILEYLYDKVNEHKKTR